MKGKPCCVEWHASVYLAVGRDQDLGGDGLVRGATFFKRLCLAVGMRWGWVMGVREGESKEGSDVVWAGVSYRLQLHSESYIFRPKWTDTWLSYPSFSLPVYLLSCFPACYAVHVPHACFLLLFSWLPQWLRSFRRNGLSRFIIHVKVFSWCGLPVSLPACQPVCLSVFPCVSTSHLLKDMTVFR